MLTPLLAFAPPTPGDYLENLVLLGLGILVLVLALALCDFLLDKVPRVFKATVAQAGSSSRMPQTSAQVLEETPPGNTRCSPQRRRVGRVVRPRVLRAPCRSSFHTRTLT